MELHPFDRAKLFVNDTDFIGIILFKTDRITTSNRFKHWFIRNNWKMTCCLLLSVVDGWCRLLARPHLTNWFSISSKSMSRRGSSLKSLSTIIDGLKFFLNFIKYKSISSWNILRVSMPEKPDSLSFKQTLKMRKNYLGYVNFSNIFQTELHNWIIYKDLKFKRVQIYLHILTFLSNATLIR